MNYLGRVIAMIVMITMITMITMIATTTTSATFVMMRNRSPCNLGEITPRNNRWRLVVDTNLGFSSSDWSQIDPVNCNITFGN